MKLGRSGTNHERIFYLALGTAQFGMAYGIANQQGEVSLEEVGEILTIAKDAGIDTLDTAMSYGESEGKLGQIGVHNWKVITKLPAVPQRCFGISNWVKASVADSLKRLKIEKLYGLLLHHPQDLLQDYGEELYNALQSLRSCGIVKKIGISIAILNENETRGRRGTAPAFGSEKFLFENQVGLLYLLTHRIRPDMESL